MQNKNQENNENKFIKGLKAVFVHNIGWKLLALASAVVFWTLSAGLL